MKKFFIAIVIVALISAGGYFFMQIYETQLTSEPNVPAIVGLVNSSTTETLFGNESIFLSNGKSKIIDEYQHVSAFSRYLTELLKTITMQASYNQETMQVTISGSELDYDDFLTAVLSSSDSLSQDVKNFVALGVSSDEMNGYLFSYLASYLADNTLTSVKTTQFSEDYQVKDGKLPNDSILSDYVTKFTEELTDDLITKLQTTSRQQNSAKDTSDFIIKCEVGNTVVLYISSDKENRYKATLRVNSVLEGQEAVDRLVEINRLNKNVSCKSDQKLLYIEYEVTNLSDNEVVVPDYFTYLDDEFRKYKVFGDPVIGVTSTAQLAGKATKVFGTVLVVPNTSRSVYWYDAISGETRSFDYKG